MINVPTNTLPLANDYPDILNSSFCNVYNSINDVWSDELAMRQAASFLINKLDPKSCILDVGAGRGKDTILMLNAGHTVYALDIIKTKDWDFILSNWPQQAKFIHGALLEVKLEQIYDAIIDNGCFHHQHPKLYLNYLCALFKYAKPGALLMLSLFTPLDDIMVGKYWVQPDGRLTREFTKSEAHILLEKSGWNIQEMFIINRNTGLHNYLLIMAKKVI